MTEVVTPIFTRPKYHFGLWCLNGDPLEERAMFEARYVACTEYNTSDYSDWLG